MTQVSAEMSRLVIKVMYSAGGYIMEAVTPSISINGRPFPCKWGTHEFDLAPGVYEIAVSYPWVFSKQCGRAAMRISMQPGATKKITYCTNTFTFLPGSISIDRGR